MSAKIDLAGQRFGRLYVIEDTGKRKRQSIVYLCKCDCGKLVETTSVDMRQGDSKSCGCLKTEMMTKHGYSRTRLYRIFRDMWSRCNNKKDTGYGNYGAKGVSVCLEWKDFVEFKEWALQNGYHDDLSIDRIDPTGNYEPSNCRWVTMEVQHNNKRNSLWLEVNGERLTLAQVSRKYNLNYHTLLDRYYHGVRGNQLIVEPIKNTKYKISDIEEAKWLLNHTSLTQREIGEICKICISTIGRIKHCQSYVDIQERQPTWWAGRKINE